MKASIPLHVHFTTFKCNGGLKAVGARQGWKWGPMMTSSYSANCDKTFWSSLGKGYAGHPLIRSSDYGMFDITENAKGYSWCTALKTRKARKAKLATSWGIASWHRPHFSSFTVAVGGPFESKALTHWRCCCGPFERKALTVTVAIGDPIVSGVLSHYSCCWGHLWKQSTYLWFSSEYMSGEYVFHQNWKKT